MMTLTEAKSHVKYRRTLTSHWFKKHFVSITTGSCLIIALKRPLLAQMPKGIASSGPSADDATISRCQSFFLVNGLVQLSIFYLFASLRLQTLMIMSIQPKPNIHRHKHSESSEHCERYQKGIKIAHPFSYRERCVCVCVCVRLAACLPVCLSACMSARPWEKTEQ